MSSACQSWVAKNMANWGTPRIIWMSAWAKQLFLPT
jgi:hypothetical protein